MRQSDSAGRQAQEVVGLYGDPDTTWGICLELGVTVPVVPEQVWARLTALAADFPHLGSSWQVEEVEPAGWAAARARVAAAPYDVGGPLVRVLGDGRGRVLVAAHHGVCDGLGLLALAAAACGLEVVSHARGIGDRPAPSSFLRSSFSRVVEALLRPPPRFAAHQVGTSAGEHLVVRPVPRLAAGSVELAMAVALVFSRWNPPGRRSATRPLLVAGASRRAPGALAPDRRTAYLRFRLDPAWDRARAKQAFGSVAPEPEFPETSARGIGPAITRLLRGRLGGTAQISNLGVVEADGLDYAAMFPALSGPRAFAVGLVTTGQTTTVSLRTRGSEFSSADTEALVDLITAALAEVAA